MPRSLTKTLTVSALTAAALAAPPAAWAAPNPYTGQEICGPTFGLYRDIPIRSHDGKVEMGRLQVLVSAWAGKSCAVVIKTRRVGQPTFTSVSIAKQRKKIRWTHDDGRFRYYAGPVYAKGPCTRAGGYLHYPNGREGIFVEGAPPPGC